MLSSSIGDIYFLYIIYIYNQKITQYTLRRSLINIISYTCMIYIAQLLALKNHHCRIKWNPRLHFYCFQHLEIIRVSACVYSIYTRTHMYMYIFSAPENCKITLFFSSLLKEAREHRNRLSRFIRTDDQGIKTRQFCLKPKRVGPSCHLA